MIVHITLRIGDEEHDLYLARENGNVKVEVDGETLDVKVVDETPEGLVLEVAGARFTIALAGDDAVVVDGDRLDMEIAEFRPGGAPGAHGGGRGKGARVKPPMPGKIVGVRVGEGDEVQQGQVLVILEAMKMQNEIASPTSGVVKAVHVKVGQSVEAKDVLVEIE